MTETRIEELRSEAGWRAAFPVMSQLRPALDEEGYLERLRDAARERYRLFALVEGDGQVEAGNILALAGVVVRTNLIDGRHAWVDDLVTVADRRSEGHGERLLSWVFEWAGGEGCELVGLASGVQRGDAHRFYEDRIGMERTAYLYKHPT